MANPTFTDALSSMRRKAQLSGRPLSKQETAGAVAGYANTASERLYRGRSLQLTQESEDRQYDIAKDQMKQDKRRDTATAVIGGGVAGASIGGSIAAGASAGSVVGPYGTAIGAGIGAIVGFISTRCMIISACNGPESYEVELSRKYRDRFMSNFELIGYYTIAPPVAALIHRHRPIKRLIKTQLVDRMVDYAEWLFGMKSKMKNPVLSKFVTRSFLNLCRRIGKYQVLRRGVIYDGQ